MRVVLTRKTWQQLLRAWTILKDNKQNKGMNMESQTGKKSKPGQEGVEHEASNPVCRYLDTLDGQQSVT